MLYSSAIRNIYALLCTESKTLVWGYGTPHQGTLQGLSEVLRAKDAEHKGLSSEAPGVVGRTEKKQQMTTTVGPHVLLTQTWRKAGFISEG